MIEILSPEIKFHRYIFFEKDLHRSLTPSLINSQTLKMISQVESFLCPDKQGTPEAGRRIQQPKCCISAYHDKDEEKSLKNHNQNYTQKPHLKTSDRQYIGYTFILIATYSYFRYVSIL